MNFHALFIVLVVLLALAIAYITYLSIKLKESLVVAADKLGQGIAADAKKDLAKVESDASAVVTDIKAKL